MIPLSTTTITVTRVELTGGEDPYDASPPAPTTIVTGLRAVLGRPSASTQLSHGERVVYTASLTCDPADIEPGDTVTDSFGGVWTVLWARHQGTSLGLGHVVASLRMVEGAS